MIPAREGERNRRETDELPESEQVCVGRHHATPHVHRARALKVVADKENKVVKKVIKKVVKKEVAAVRKPSMKPFVVLTAEQAEEQGYEYAEMMIDDDFAAGSVNKKMKKMWVLKSE